jgi:hypothetical protein
MIPISGQNGPIGMFKNELLVKIPNSPERYQGIILNSMDWSQGINTSSWYKLWVEIFEYFKNENLYTSHT